MAQPTHLGLPWARALALLALAAAVRAPLWLEALRTPLDGDEAVIGLMSRHLLHSGHIWGQPFGSPLEPLLVAPFVAVWGPGIAPFRWPYFLLGLLLPLLAAALASRLHPSAAWPAGLLAACPPPYFLVVASQATIYPSTLVLGGALLLQTLALADRARDRRPLVPSLVAWGALAGLALWTHLMSGAVVAACGLHLLRSGLRLRLLVVPALVAATLTSPWWLAAGGDSLRIVRVASRQRSAGEHLRQGPGNLVAAAGGLVGTHVPLIVDDPRWRVDPPPAWKALVGLAWLAALAWASLGSWRRPEAQLLLAAMALAALAFPFPQRSGAHTTRYLTPLLVPFAALLGLAVARARRRTWARLALAGLLGLNVAGAATLHGAWRQADRSQVPVRLPDLPQVLKALEARGLRRGFASYLPAYRLTFDSAERVIVSQPWNERFRHYPLPWLDEVRFAKDVAWILTPDLPSDLPQPRELEAGLALIGAKYSRLEVGGAVIYHGFRAPMGARGQPLARDGAATRRDAPARDEPWAAPLATPTPLAGLTLLAPGTGLRLPRSVDVQVSPDGATFETVWQRRRAGERGELAWVNGQPQYATEHDALTIPLGGRPVAAVRLESVDPREDWAVGQVLVHAAGEEEAPWDEWLRPGLDWDERLRALRADARPTRADWLFRLSLAEASVGRGSLAASRP